MTVFREQPATHSINMNFCISFISTPIHTTADELLFPCCGTKKTTPSSATNQQKSYACAKAGDYYPPALQLKIDELNGWIYDTVNNGVYKAGFATSQQAYDEAVAKVFKSLARLEQILGQHRYLTGNQLTEADIRLWTTLVRFDPVYVTHFKCDKHRISDYLNLYGFLRDIYQMPGIAETVNFDHIRNHYFRSHKTINPTGIISIGPWQDLDEPHGRDVRFG